MIKWLNVSNTTKKRAYEQIGEKQGISAFAVEKDWWVSRTIELIFSLNIAEHLVFKGGTSLSKGWKLINRFSEDIDLALNKDFFEEFQGNLSNSKITKLRKKASSYTTTILFENIKTAFYEKGFENIDFKVVKAKNSDQDPRVLEIYYPNIINSPSSYLHPKVQLEISIRSLKEPFIITKFGSLVDEYYGSKDFTEDLLEIPTATPERTCLEKLFLLHEEFKRPNEKIRVNRLSRHLYDIYYLSKTGIVDRAINDRALYQTLLFHRYKFSRVSKIGYTLHHPFSLNPTPIESVIKEWANDYSKMKLEMIYDSVPPSFEELIDTVELIKSKLKKINWNFDLNFPNSNLN
jgi:hypothetical protein